MSPRRTLAVGHIAPGSRTVRVRIAVAIRGGTDEWAACGGSETEDGQARREVVDCFDAGDPVSVVWVVADVVVSEEPTVEGVVDVPDGPDATELLERGHEDGYRRGYAEGLRRGRTEERTTDAECPI